ncbi:hypothetical protein NECAME_08219 [Necator americanus]|uniref:RING-type domain-containing protein n=1 Tax=Necator americanus TaxID=51031 RepID=W2TLV5_NECAM|nr:hypothetical protein NECAME_08219 [Necator americanus]ETN82012.1 hypothetical protein NECAME_08219 [Necator americanus]
MSIYCAECRLGIKCSDAVQLVPCLHVICIKCQQKTRKTSKVCPARHCYSPLVPPIDIRWNPCEYERCLRKLAIAGDVYHTACQHDLCAQCFDDAYKTNNAQCPVGGCGAPLNEDDELEQCEGYCHASYEIDKMVALPCCQVYMCQPCAKKWTEGKGTCPPGKCLQKGSSRMKRGKRTPIKTPCSGQPECEGEVLRNFPSEMECEHEVCINCLAKALEECERSNSPPVCPNEACRLPYRCETVLALKALFPERAAYFSRFDLESHYSMEALRDDTITPISIQRKATLQKIELKVCFCEDEENQAPVEFEKTGPLGDLLREIRRVLKIMNTDKVYGYFKRDGDEEKQLDLCPKLIQTPVDKIGINKDTLILVDITGIVNNKATKKAAGNPVAKK